MKNSLNYSSIKNLIDDYNLHNKQPINILFNMIDFPENFTLALESLHFKDLFTIVVSDEK